MEGYVKSQFWRYVTVLMFFFAILDTVSSFTHYSIPEEMEEGSVVANLASDLGLDEKTLSRRNMRLDIISNKKYLDVNKETGELYILEKMDREYLCLSKTATTCFIKMEVILENPVRIFNFEIEIVDINDNAPQFRRDTIHLDISESTAAGERFSLSNAVDPDIGSNSIKTYYLSESEHFDIEIQTGRDGSKFADLILKMPLDREKQASHNLILTAVDGGVPARSGTASIIVRVLDTNDNAPQFDKDSYNINLTENAPIGSLSRCPPRKYFSSHSAIVAIIASSSAGNIAVFLSGRTIRSFIYWSSCIFLHCANYFLEPYPRFGTLLTWFLCALSGKSKQWNLKHSYG
uniref:Cadherin domain-containing protein n=1 Tax=Cyprinus carpio TaxID=7962 RepID=A0A8C1PYA7_CYPCA